MKKILIIVILFIFFTNITSATVFSTDAYGTGTYSISGTDPGDVELRIYQKESGNYYWEAVSRHTYYMQSSGNGEFRMYDMNVRVRGGSGSYAKYTYYEKHHIPEGGCTGYTAETHQIRTEDSAKIILNDYIKSGYGMSYWYHMGLCGIRLHGELIVTFFTNNTYYIIGNTSCVTSVDLYKYTDEGYLYMYTDNTTEDDYYNFTIIDGANYILVFSDGHEYEFTCDGSDIKYDYSACTYIYGYTCNINWVKLWRNDAGSWTCIKTESQPYYGVNIYLMQIESGYNYKLNFSDGHEYEFTCDGSDIEYDWDRCIWVFPPSPWQPPEIIPWYLGYDNNIIFMRDSHGNFIENAQIAVYNKNTGNYTQKWTNTPDPYILLAANNDSNDDVIVMCRTFDGVFTLETVDPAFGTDENVTWTNWTIPIMYNLEIHPTDQSNMPLHHVFVSMYEYAPFDPLAFFGYDTYWGCIPVTNCSGFSRCDIVAEKEGYRDYNVTGLNWTTKSALIKDYKQDIVLKRES